jgi:hypothetical protein
VGKIIPRFGVSELADPTNEATREFREIYQDIHGHPPTEMKIYQRVPNLSVSFVELWDTPMAATQRSAIAARAEKLCTSEITTNVLWHLNQNASRTELFTYLHDQIGLATTAAVLGVSFQSASNYAHFLNLTSKSVPWTPHQEEVLKNKIGKTPIAEIAKTAGKTEAAVHGKASYEGLLSPRNVRAQLPPDWPNTTDDVLVRWREANQKSAMILAIQHYRTTGELITPENSEQITGLNWPQLMGIGDYAKNKPVHRQRIFENALNFWKQFTDELSSDTSSDSLPHTFSPFLINSHIRHEDSSAEFLSKHKTAEQRRLIQLSLSGIASGKEFSTAEAFADHVGVLKSALFSGNADYAIGPLAHLGRFGSSLHFLEQLESARTKRIADLNAKDTLSDLERTELSHLNSFSVWHIKFANNVDFQSNKARIQSLFDADRTHIQGWTTLLRDQMTQEAGKPPTVKALATRIAEMPVTGWRTAFPNSVVGISNMLVGYGNYSPDVSARYVFPSRDALLSASRNSP